MMGTNDIVIGQRAVFLFKSKKQKFVQNRYRSIEKNWRTLFNFGYVVDQISQVLPHGGGYQHVLVLTPWRANILPARQYGNGGITVGAVILTEYEPQEKALFEPEHDDGGYRKRAALIWTPPIDVKRQALAPIRYSRFSFAAEPDGSIDFEHVIDAGGNDLLPSSFDSRKLLGAVNGLQAEFRLT
jgi:hypothetical protein